MQRGRIAWMACAGVWLIYAPPVAAEKASERIQLRYTAPTDCPDRNYVLRAIDALVETDATLDPTLDVVARVDAKSPGDYSLNLRWTSDNGAGQRSLEAESCQAAADAAAWLIALAIKQPAEAETPAPRDDRSAHELRYELGVDAAGALGVLPGVAWGASLRVGIAWSALHADLSLGYFPGKRAERTGATVDLDLVEVGLRACYLVAGLNLAVGPCARAALGSMAASSRGLRTPGEGAERFQMLAIGLEMRARLADSLWLMSDAALAWHQRRPVFVISGAGELHQPRSVGLWLGLGFVLVL